MKSEVVTINKRVSKRCLAAVSIPSRVDVCKLFPNNVWYDERDQRSAITPRVDSLGSVGFNLVSDSDQKQTSQRSSQCRLSGSVWCDTRVSQRSFDSGSIILSAQDVYKEINR